MFGFVVGVDFEYLVVGLDMKWFVVVLGDLEVFLLVVFIMELEVSLCICVQGVFECFFVVGLCVVYELYVCVVDGCVVDVWVIFLVLVEVIVLVLSNEGDGIVFDELVECVWQVLSDEDVCLLVDCLIVQVVCIICYLLCVVFYYYLGFEVEFMVVVVWDCF